MYSVVYLDDGYICKFVYRIDPETNETIKINYRVFENEAPVKILVSGGSTIPCLTNYEFVQKALALGFRMYFDTSADPNPVSYADTIRII